MVERWNIICVMLRRKNRFIFRLSFLVFALLCYFPSDGREYRGIVKGQEKGNYVLSEGDFSVMVSALKGGRIISLKRAGKEMLLQDTVHPKYYGATLWPSPQCRFWPPSPVLDESPYRAKCKGNTLRLISRRDSLTGFCFIKEFSLSQDGALIIDYKIKNISDTVRHVAAWDVVRVPGGTTFFPVKERELNALSSDLEHLSEEGGILWYVCPQDTVRKGQKLFATTTEGWLAHRYGNLLLIKEFPTVPKEELPYKQGEVEIFLAPNNLYVELENHGSYTALQPGAFLVYRQKWHLCHLEDDVIRDRHKLTDYVRKQVGLVAAPSIELK